MIVIVTLALAAFVGGCAGLGLIAQRALPGQPEPGFAPLTGCVVVLWLSSLLDAVGAFHIGVLSGLVGIGLVIVGWAAWGRGLRSRRAVDWVAPAAVVVAATTLMLFIPAEFNLNDDGPAYLLFSEKLRLLGETGAEPFSERRLYSLGGQFGLAAMTQGLFGPRWLTAYEPGLGLALIGATIAALGRERPVRTALSLAMIMALAVVSITVGARPIANLAPALLYAAILYGAVSTWLRIADRPEQGDADLVLLALYSAAALTLRPTALPFVGLLAVSAALLTARSGRWIALGLAVVAAAVMLAPAMASSLRASGTALYPFLGNGVHTPLAYLPSAPMEVLAMAASEWPGALLLICVVGLVAVLARLGRAPRGAVLLAGLTVVAYGAMTWAIGGEQLSRYSFPFVFAVLCALIPALPLSMPNRSPRMLPVASGGAAALALLVLALPPVEGLIASKAPAALAGRWAQPVLSGAPQARWRAAQASIPEGATLLSIAGAYTAFLDLKRNRVLCADQPGTAGPNGGWPREPGSPKAWLERSGIDYVLVEPGFMTARSGQDTAWRRGLGQATALAQSQLAPATAGVRPTFANDELTIYAVADLND